MSADNPFASLHAGIDNRPSPLRAAISAACRHDEREAVQALLAQAPDDTAAGETIRAVARHLVQTVRDKRSHASGVDALMHEFSLSSEEGVALMCLAEALLRIPDTETADRLIADKISKGDWRRHLGESPSLFVNAATWGLLVTGRLVGNSSEQGLSAALSRLIAKGGEPLIRKGVNLAMRMLGNQFVTGQTIDEALANSRDNEARGYRYSYDMLGEAALTADDAANYFASYENALHAIGRAASGRGIRNGPGMSVKLSALHPRYARAQRARVMEELLPRLTQLMLLAKQYDIGLNIDAEEADRLELSLDLLEALALDPALAGFDGIGIVVQAYQKRCPHVIDYLIDLARRGGRRFMVRLVKGAYWDTEIKRAQIEGLSGYPVYTRKLHTDVSYLVCARKLLAAGDAIYPQFATHNAQTLATVYVWAKQQGILDYEFQCLHGMGETLYDQVVGPDKLDRPCRIYAPVGSHKTLLAYLVRRLLENGANSSFVNRIVDDSITIDALIEDPFTTARKSGCAPHPRIPLPADLYGNERRNSSGIDWNSEDSLCEIASALLPFGTRQWQASPLLADMSNTGGHARPLGPPQPSQPISNPADRHDVLGQVFEASRDEVEQALSAAAAAAGEWQQLAAGTRADILERGAILLERHQPELLALAVREAGKTLPNAVAEVREAVDFLRYYATQARRHPAQAALGPVVCISPWNFPLAIFIGEVSAALAAGNTVLAKPAEQTPLIASRSVALLHEAGIPHAALQLLPGRGETVGAALIADKRVRGVIFTGSTEVAQQINRILSARMVAEQQEIVLVAETGGQNAMIVDSSALPEQVVQDVIASAFDSAGQRCSALRVLCLQEEIADRTLAMLKGALRELRIGKPDRLDTDIGPVIDEEARAQLLAHIERMQSEARSVFQLPLPPACADGSFVPPTVIEIVSMAQLQKEVFGPILHVLRYRREALPQLVDAINATGYGLTLGIHSRIDETIDFITAHAHVGNIYVNRNMVGAVVGVQPFGGEGKSGTGPKAGGPLYLKRLQREPQILPSLRQGVHPALPAFDALMSWARAQDEAQTVAWGDMYQQRSLWHVTLALPGPTGERNVLRFTDRGSVLCIAATRSMLLNQLSASFATGNTAVIPASSAGLLPSRLPAAVHAMLTVLDDSWVDHALLQGALVDEASASCWLPKLAARKGAVVPVIITDEMHPVPVWRLVAERALCINTTAAGGNASLMTLDA